MNLELKNKKECRYKPLGDYFTIESIMENLGYTRAYTYGLLNGTWAPTNDTKMKLESMIKELPENAR